jgi:nucleoside-diphosphate-sugar epimerase
MEKGKPGETYIIGGPAYRIVEVMDIASKITGKPTPLIKASPGLMRINAALMGVIGAVVPLPEPFSAESMRYSTETTNLGSSAKAERELGFKARAIEEGMRQTLEYEMARMKKG